MMFKQKPKSCGCPMCRRGAGTAAGNAQRRHEERAARRSTEQALRQGRYEAIAPAHRGSYTD